MEVFQIYTQNFPIIENLNPRIMCPSIILEISSACTLISALNIKSNLKIDYKHRLQCYIWLAHVCSFIFESLNRMLFPSCIPRDYNIYAIIVRENIGEELSEKWEYILSSNRVVRNKKDPK